MEILIAKKKKKRLYTNSPKKNKGWGPSCKSTTKKKVTMDEIARWGPKCQSSITLGM